MSMTESEAKALAEWLKVRKGKTLKLNDDGIDCVVEALTEVQAYRATGLTPELIEAMKGHNIALINDLGEYQQIGTIEEFKALKQWKSDIIESFSKYDVNSVDELMKRFRELTEKAEPKKQGNVHDLGSHLRLSNVGFLCCGATNKDIRYPLISLRDLDYCPRCGQRLDWE